MKTSSRFTLLRNVLISICFTSPIVSIVACSPCRNIMGTSNDSVRIEIVEREIMSYDTVEIQIPKSRESVTTQADSSILANKFTVSSAIVRPNGELIHTLETIPQRIKKPIRTTTTARDSIIYREKKVVQTVEVERELSKFQELQISGFWILLALVLLHTLISRRF